MEAVVAPIIAVGIGYWADTRLDSSPWGLGIGAVVGFGAMVLRLVRLGREMGLTASDSGPDPAGRPDESGDEDDAGTPR